MIKRLFDILFSVLGIIMFSGVMILAAIAVRLESPGPAIFRQRRAGRFGRPFTMLKFRTMRSDVDPYDSSPSSAQDARLTKVGRFLRETSLDELPQLFNVLVGQMSLVGPRPLYERQAALWDDRQKHRLDVRPGITGYAQVYGRGKITIEEKIELDLYYVQHQNILLDIKLIFKTIAGVFTRGDIYEKRYSRHSQSEKRNQP